MAQTVDLNLRLTLAHDDGAPLTEDELQKLAFAAYRAAFRAIHTPRALPFLHVEITDVTADVLVGSGEVASTTPVRLPLAA